MASGATSRSTGPGGCRHAVRRCGTGEVDVVRCHRRHYLRRSHRGVPPLATIAHRSLALEEEYSHRRSSGAAERWARAGRGAGSGGGGGILKQWQQAVVARAPEGVGGGTLEQRRWRAQASVSGGIGKCTHAVGGGVGSSGGVGGASGAGEEEEEEEEGDEEEVLRQSPRSRV
jgi:hypothetical protein